MVKKVIDEFGLLTGLKVKNLVAFGLYRGFFVKLTATRMGQFHLLVTFPKEEHKLRVQAKIDEKALLKMVGSMGQVLVEPGVVSINFMPKLRKPGGDSVKGLLDTVTNILQTTTSPYDDSCTQCGNTGVDTALINGIPALLCPACLDKIKQEAGGARSAFEAYNPNYGKGLTYALPAVVVSALIWAIIAYFLEVIFLFAGFLIGLFVSYALVYGTEKINGSVIGLAVVVTILAVLLGEIFAAAFALLAEGVSLSYLPDFLGWYITEYPGDFAIVMFTALIGAAYISYRLWSAGKEQRATFDVVS